jgi:uncharacterized protein YpmS
LLLAVLLVVILSLTSTAGITTIYKNNAQLQGYDAIPMQENAVMQTNNKNIANTPQTSVKTQKVEAATKKSKTSTRFTLAEIKDAAARVKSYIETYHKLPNYVTVGTTQVKMSDFLKLLTAGLLQINSGKTTHVILKTVNAPSKPTESIKSGSMTKSGYLDLAKRVNAFIDANGKIPNYADSNLGKLRYENMIYLFSRILAFQKTNHRLPDYVTVTPWSTVPASLQKYLKATTNCQVNNAQIKSRAKSISSCKSSTYGKAAAIFKWVNDHTTYAYYSNSQKGAVNTLKANKGNCCDLSHLLIALERAAGIPARYVHGCCHFSSGEWMGHVWAQVWVDGKWYTADSSWSTNTLGVVNNWDRATAITSGKNYGTFACLPF